MGAGAPKGGDAHIIEGEMEDVEPLVEGMVTEFGGAVTVADYPGPVKVVLADRSQGAIR